MGWLGGGGAAQEACFPSSMINSMHHSKMQTACQEQKASPVEILDSGQVVALLAGILVPAELDDLAWTAGVAKETQVFLRTLHTQQDKTVMGQALGTFAGFFAAGLLSKEPSAGALPAPAKPAPSETQPDAPPHASAG
jgi:hypothetical protein